MRWLAWLVVVVAVGITVLYCSDPLFWQRYAMLMNAKWQGNSLGDWYDPMVPVTGNPHGPLAYAGKGDNFLSAQLERELTTYAAEHNSSSLLVWYRGQLITEAYFDGAERDTLLTSRSMAKPLASIVVARAIQEDYIQSLDQSAADSREEPVPTTSPT